MHVCRLGNRHPSWGKHKVLTRSVLLLSNGLTGTQTSIDSIQGALQCCSGSSSDLLPEMGQLLA